MLYLSRERLLLIGYGFPRAYSTLCPLRAIQAALKRLAPFPRNGPARGSLQRKLPWYYRAEVAGL